MGDVFGFFTTVEPSDPRREAKLMVYDRMLASMRIDPVILHQRGLDGIKSRRKSVRWRTTLPTSSRCKR